MTKLSSALEAQRWAESAGRDVQTEDVEHAWRALQDVYAAEASQEYSTRVQDSALYFKAYERFMSALTTFNCSDATEEEIDFGAPVTFPGARSLRVQGRILDVAVQLLRNAQLQANDTPQWDKTLESLSETVAQSLKDLEVHLHPDLGLLSTVLDHDRTRPDDDNYEFFDMGMYNEVTFL